MQLCNKSNYLISDYTLFYKKIRSGTSTEGFLASGDLEYSKFLNHFLKIEQQAKENVVL